MSDEVSISDSETPPVFAGRVRRLPDLVKTHRLGDPHYTNVSCEESAKRRHQPLYAELKSILFSTTDGRLYVLAHVPGNCRVNQKNLQAAVGVPLCLLTPAQLKARNLEKGRINPFTTKYYLETSLVHVVSPLVFRNERVHSNNDEVGGHIEFSPVDIIHSEACTLVYPIADSEEEVSLDRLKAFST